MTGASAKTCTTGSAPSRSICRPCASGETTLRLLAAALLERVAPQRRLAISPAAITLLQAQEFPGNVRELRNLLERAALLCDGDTMESGHVEQALLSGRRPAARAAELHPAAPRGLREIEHAALRERTAKHRGSRAALAAELGISERSLYRKLKAAGAA